MSLQLSKIVMCAFFNCSRLPRILDNAKYSRGEGGHVTTCHHRPWHMRDHPGMFRTLKRAASHWIPGFEIRDVIKPLNILELGPGDGNRLVLWFSGFRWSNGDTEKLYAFYHIKHLTCLISSYNMCQWSPTCHICWTGHDVRDGSSERDWQKI